MSSTASHAATQPELSPIRWAGGALELLDQTRLPAEEVWIRCEEPEQVAEAIRRMAVRGAPAIGVAAAYGMALASDVEGAARCAVWLANRRGTTKLVHTSEVIEYHQQRNRAARLSRQKRSPMRL